MARFSKNVVNEVSKHLREVADALDIAESSLERPPTVDDSIAIEAYLEDVRDRANQALEEWGWEQARVWPETARKIAPPRRYS